MTNNSAQMYAVLRKIAESWKADDAGCSAFDKDNLVISSQVESEVNAAMKGEVNTANMEVDEDVIESDEVTEKIFGSIAEIYEDEGVSVIDASGRAPHFVEQCKIVVSKDVILMKGDRVSCTTCCHEQANAFTDFILR